MSEKQIESVNDIHIREFVKRMDNSYICFDIVVHTYKHERIVCISVKDVNETNEIWILCT